MKITITLTDAQVKGIKAYNKATDSEHLNNKEGISQMIRAMVTDVIDNPSEAIHDYIQEFQNKL